MDDETHGMLQQLLDLSKSQSNEINRLQAYNGLQNFAILEILSSMDLNRTILPEVKEAYLRIRSSAKYMASLSDDKEGFESFVSFLDNKFLT